MALAIAKKGIDVILTYNSKKDEADEGSTHNALKFQEEQICNITESGYK